MNRPVGTFVRDGVTREAYTQGEVVALRAAGWREAPPAASAVQPESAPGPEPEQSTGQDRTRKGHGPGDDEAADKPEVSE